MEKDYIIEIEGCDDTTYVKLKLTKLELNAIIKLAKQSHLNSTFNCMPVINIEGFNFKKEE